MPKTPRMARKRKLSVSDRLARLRPIVEALPDGDPDRDDLITLFNALETAIEDNRQLQGALRVARYALEVALEKIEKQQETLEVLAIGKD